MARELGHVHLDSRQEVFIQVIIPQKTYILVAKLDDKKTNVNFQVMGREAESS